LPETRTTRRTSYKFSATSSQGSTAFDTSDNDSRTSGEFACKLHRTNTHTDADCRSQRHMKGVIDEHALKISMLANANHPLHTPCIGP
jgi:hypothetical protein